MRKLSDTLKNIAERQDFVMDERLKREYVKEGYEVPVDTCRKETLTNLLSREDFVNEAELKASYTKIEMGNIKGKLQSFRQLTESERCLGFDEFLKSREK